MHSSVFNYLVFTIIDHFTSQYTTISWPTVQDVARFFIALRLFYYVYCITLRLLRVTLFIIQTIVVTHVTPNSH